jgi:hypothetical protein
MKTHHASHGRNTVEIQHMSLAVNSAHIEAHNIAPFLIRAKWSYEPAIPGNMWDEPSSPEWFAFDGLYAYHELVFRTEEGVVVTISPAVDLLQVFTQAQLDIVEQALREGWERDAEDMAEHIYDCQQDYEYGI